VYLLIDGCGVFFTKGKMDNIMQMVAEMMPFQLCFNNPRHDYGNMDYLMHDKMILLVPNI
jgi:hypothetical protein